MPLTPYFLDVSVSVTPPGGYKQPLPVTLGPGRQNNDVRVAFITCSGASGGTALEMVMTSNPPTGFTAAYSLNPTYETHGVFYRRLTDTDTDNVTVSWAKPTGWGHFMFGLVTVRGMSTTTAPTGGWLKPNQTMGDTAAVTSSVTVPGAGVMLFFAGTVPTPWGGSNTPSWPVSLGVPTGWTHIAATDKSGNTFDQYSNDPALVIVGKSFTAAGSTGSVSFPTSKGSPAFSGLYLFCPVATDVSATLTAA